jgi:hypothetical protein
MNNYIQIYKNAIDDEYCDELITKFNIDSKQETYDQGPMSFTQVNLNQNKWQGDITKLSSVFTKYLEQYKNDCIITDQMWPEKYAFEEIRLKKYLPNNKDRFDPHVDSINIESAKRFLVFFIYLQDNLRGETNFPQLGLASPCKKGSLLMFPPLWPWLHQGMKPVEQPKYIIGSYLHYTLDSK